MEIPWLKKKNKHTGELFIFFFRLFITCFPPLPSSYFSLSHTRSFFSSLARWAYQPDCSSTYPILTLKPAVSSPRLPLFEITQGRGGANRRWKREGDSK